MDADKSCNFAARLLVPAGVLFIIIIIIIIIIVLGEI